MTRPALLLGGLRLFWAIHLGWGSHVEREAKSEIDAEDVTVLD